MPNKLSLDALANRDFILMVLSTRFFNTFVTLIGVISSFILYGSQVRHPASYLSAFILLITIFFAYLLINDISTLPVNIFYFWSLLSGADLTNKWIQIIGFGSPIVSLLIFAMGPLLVVLLSTGSLAA